MILVWQDYFEAKKGACVFMNDYIIYSLRVVLCEILFHKCLVVDSSAFIKFSCLSSKCLSDLKIWFWSIVVPFELPIMLGVN